MRSLHQNTRQAAELYKRKDEAYAKGQLKGKTTPFDKEQNSH